MATAKTPYPNCWGQVQYPPLNNTALAFSTEMDNNVMTGFSNNTLFRDDNMSKFGGKFSLQDVRCFAGREEFKIRPLTFLVGENSTGKSTLLGCFQALNDLLMPDSLAAWAQKYIDFNQAPYQMGGYRDIARKTKSIAPSFVLGLETEEGGLKKYQFTFAEREDGSEPVIKEYKLVFSDGEVTFQRAQKGADLQLDVQQKGDTQFIVSLPSTEDSLPYFIRGMLFAARHSEKLDPNTEELLTSLGEKMLFGDQSLEELYPNTRKLRAYLGKKEEESNFLRIIGSYNVHSFAAIRTKPERTYNPILETADPSGSEMPMVLRNLKQEEWVALNAQLKKFGQESGLFTDIKVKKLGSSSSDPFQLQVRSRGAMRNLIDVGYGISQILPILVRLLLSSEEGQFLLQQPEVHLHPKAQAALASLLVELINGGDHGFIVETHSDQMIDRACIAIRNKQIAPHDVSLIYLEPAKNKVKVHNIEFDDKGNMKQVPGSYRGFFLKEQTDLLGFTD